MNFIKYLPRTKQLKFFLEKSYGIELLLFLYENNNFSGIENLYYEIQYPKGRLPSFRKFVYYLYDKNCVKIEDNNKNKTDRFFDEKDTRGFNTPHAKSVLALFTELKYDLNDIRDGKPVKPVFFTQLPRGINELDSIKNRKKIFI